MIEDRPILERAQEIALPGDINSLSNAIIQARAIAKNRALYRDAQREIRDWQVRIERMEDQPILEAQLQDKRADLVIRPHNSQEVIDIAKTCVKYQIPLTVRGAGTGNYGQCVPLQGGVILDTTKLTKIISIEPGTARVEAGVKMASFDKHE